MTIEKIRNNIHNNIGNVAFIKHNEGRNKIFEYEGKVVEAYQNVFVILDRNSKKSFSYYDILTDTIKISFKCKNRV